MYKKLSKKYTILCVDDNANNLFTLNALLSTVKNINTLEAISGKEALKVLLTNHVDLILSDVQMPEINGFELAKMIKSNKKTKDIPIIFVTAVFKSEEFIKQGFELGAVDYITKPIDDHQLINKLTLYLKIFDEKSRVIQREKRFYDIAQSMGDGIFTMDTKGETTFMNVRAQELLGFEQRDLLGKKIHDYIHYKDIDNNQITNEKCEICNSVKSGKKLRKDNAYFIKKDGSFLSVSMVVTPLYEDTKIIGIITVFRDKTNTNKIIILEKEKIDNQEQIIKSMINMIESRDSYTAGHTKRVAEYCGLIAQEMNYSDDNIELLKKAAWLHDIGKISTPDSVLLKPSKLNSSEYALIQEHLTSGYNMLKEIDQYSQIASIMREHHERYDGSGYPQGLKANTILPLSRIMIVADAFDAMTTNRVYKPRKSVKIALQELQELSMQQFHPEVVNAALKALSDIDVDKNISQLPESSIEQQRFSYFYKDRLTNLFVIEYLPFILRYYLHVDAIYLYDIKLHNFSKYNDKNGWDKGDEFLVDFASFLDGLYQNVVVFRIEGDDFMILSESKITSIENDLERSKKFEDTVVEFSISEKYIKNINEYNESLLDIVKK